MKTDAASIQLTDQEEKELFGHELTIQLARIDIEEGIKALRDIRDRKLYRNTHATLGEFCRDELGWDTALYELIVSMAE